MRKNLHCTQEGTRWIPQGSENQLQRAPGDPWRTPNGAPWASWRAPNGTPWAPKRVPRGDLGTQFGSCRRTWDTKAMKESTHAGLGGSGGDLGTDLGLQKNPQMLQNRVPKRIEIWNSVLVNFGHRLG